MTLNQILSTLQSIPDDHDRAVEFGRVGFFHWLLSIPENEDVVAHAKKAHARASVLKRPGPSVGELCHLLEMAAHSKPGVSVFPSRRKRRKRATKNRAVQSADLHSAQQSDVLH